MGLGRKQLTNLQALFHLYVFRDGRRCGSVVELELNGGGDPSKTQHLELP